METEDPRHPRSRLPARASCHRARSQEPCGTCALLLCASAAKAVHQDNTLHSQLTLTG